MNIIPLGADITLPQYFQGAKKIPFRGLLKLSVSNVFSTLSFAVLRFHAIKILCAIFTLMSSVLLSYWVKLLFVLSPCYSRACAVAVNRSIIGFY